MKHLNEYIIEKSNKEDVVIDDIKVSNEIFTKCFKCDLKKCKGTCCARKEEIDGALLQENEINILEEIVPIVTPYLTKEGLDKIVENGPVAYNSHKQPITQIVESDKLHKCAFAIQENGCTLCAIDKAFREGNSKLRELNFSKPISCHLYPIKCNDNKLVYDKDKDCKCIKNFKEPLYMTQKEPLVRLFGEEWYQKLLDKIHN